MIKINEKDFDQALSIAEVIWEDINRQNIEDEKIGPILTAAFTLTLEGLAARLGLTGQRKTNYVVENLLLVNMHYYEEVKSGLKKMQNQDKSKSEKK